MLIKKKKEKSHVSEQSKDYNAMVLTMLMRICEQGEIINDAFVMEEKDICVYADVIMVNNNVAQITFQIHHAWLMEPIVESIAASGDSDNEALLNATKDFYKFILSLLIMALDYPETGELVVSLMNEQQLFRVYRSTLHGVGKREGILEGDFWDMLKDDICVRLGYKKVFWAKVFTSKNKNKDNVVSELRMNGLKISDLSEKLLAYAEDWDCLGTYHTEKQYFLLVREEDNEEINTFTKEEIIFYTEKSIKLFEKCHHREDFLKIRRQIFKMTKDPSLTYELCGIIPEIYCIQEYPEAEYGDKIFIMHKNKITKALYQSQLASYSYIASTVQAHLYLDKVQANTIARVTQFSANARAIRKALEEGSRIEELLLPGIGFIVGEDYKIR